MTTIKTINGKKFFQDGLTKLKVEHDCYPLPASAVCTYVLFHLECDDLGRVHANSFSLTKFTKMTGIPSSTLYGGMEALFQRGFIQEVIVKNQPYYEIIGYSTWNTPEFNIHSGREEGLNYFRIPYKITEGSALKRLVSSRDAAGIIMLLDLFNAFTRLVNLKGKKAEEGLTRRMGYLKQKMKKTALKIRQWAEIIEGLFTFEPVGVAERRPRKDRLTVRKQNNPVQVFIEKFKVTINPSLIAELEDTYDTQQVEAAVRKEVSFKLVEEGIKHTQKDIRDILGSVKQEVIDVMKYYNESIPRRNKVIFDVFNSAFGQFIDFYKDKKENDPENQVRSIGAFIRSSLISSFGHYVNNPNPYGEVVEEAIFHYANANRKYPNFIQKMK
ncbi:hypothetical protein [Robertmurraya sp. FSL R5-0851]|uniref:hypothetical protein n=1 Tax=Robertmurraya sp. FSL R5-0851 TaxID=2921584 RepID=UPI0030F82545